MIRGLFPRALGFWGIGGDTRDLVATANICFNKAVSHISHFSPSQAWFYLILIFAICDIITHLIGELQKFFSEDSLLYRTASDDIICGW